MIGPYYTIMYLRTSTLNEPREFRKSVIYLFLKVEAKCGIIDGHDTILKLVVLNSFLGIFKSEIMVYLSYGCYPA